LVRWHAFGGNQQGLLRIKRGGAAAGSGLLRSSLDEIGGPEFTLFLRLATSIDVRAEAWACAGEIDDALDAMAETMEWVQRAEELWIFPEFLRRKGELLMTREHPVMRRWPRITFGRRSTPTTGCPVVGVERRH
jgi:hypothetical protein